MNLQKKLKCGLLALTAALVVTSVPADAQQLYKAAFNLPFEAQWGSVVLEPGQYTITVEEAFSGHQVIRLRGQGELAILAGPSSPAPVGNHGRLTFVTVNGVYSLRKFEADAIGQSFIFPALKTKGQKSARNGDTPEATAVALSTH